MGRTREGALGATGIVFSFGGGGKRGGRQLASNEVFVPEL